MALAHGRDRTRSYLLALDACNPAGRGIRLSGRRLFISGRRLFWWSWHCLKTGNRLTSKRSFGCRRSTPVMHGLSACSSNGASPPALAVRHSHEIDGSYAHRAARGKSSLHRSGSPRSYEASPGPTKYRRLSGIQRSTNWCSMASVRAGQRSCPVRQTATIPSGAAARDGAASIAPRERVAPGV